MIKGLITSFEAETHSRIVAVSLFPSKRKEVISCTRNSLDSYLATTPSFLDPYDK
jgi:hypothetical protein